MNGDTPSPRLQHLLSRLSDGLLDAAEMEELDSLLLADASARDYYRCHAAVHVALGNVSEAGKVISFPGVRNRWKWPALAAAAAVVLTAGTVWWSLRHAAPAVPPVADQEHDDAPVVVAVISETTDLRWDLDQAPESGQPLHPGIVRLASGHLSLSMAGGQTVQLQGPAEFELMADGEFALRRGPAAFRTVGSGGPFFVHLPMGAVVDQGSDYSVNVEADGTAEVRVFQNQVVASTIGSSGRTLEERQLGSGSSIRVNSRLLPGTMPAAGFLRVQPSSVEIPPSHHSEASYATGVLASSPAAYWRFENLDPQGMVPDELGNHPLELMERSKLSGNNARRFMVVNGSDAAGFAMTRLPIPGLNTNRGLTVECLLFSSAENHGTAITLEQGGASRMPPGTPSHIRHAPQSFAIERMGRKGEHIGHIHPDFALRALFRSPPGYTGGTNLYSSESHLLFRWVHVAAVHDGTRILLYVDGELSDSTEASLPFLDLPLRPIIGRLQPHPQDELRQWIGGIDEVALYGRALAAEEIRAHVSALHP